jgi:hypothetical protein
MDFDDFIRSNKVIKAEKDIQKVKALVKMSNSNLEYVSKLVIDEKSATIIFVNYYEALRQILEAMSLSEGYKVFSHEAYTYYLRNKNEESISMKFERLRKLRNGANYYGKFIHKDVVENAKIEIGEMVNLLKRKYLKDII